MDGGVELNENVFGSTMNENTVTDGSRVSINKNVSANENQNQNARKVEIRMEIRIQRALVADIAKWLLVSSKIVDWKIVSF